MNSKQTKAAVIMAVGALAEAFNRQASDAMVRAYAIGLEGLTAQQIESAAAAALRSCRFMPTPAELRELAGEIRVSDRAEIAWAAFERAVRIQGGYRSVCFDDPAINATVISLGGWKSCCEMPAKEFDQFLRPKFLKAYEAAVRTRSGAGALTGMFAAHNASHGVSGDPRAPKTVLIVTGLPAAPGLPLLTDVPALTHSPMPRDLPRLKTVPALEDEP